MTIELTVAVGLACSFAGVYIGIAGYKRTQAKDNQDTGENRGVLLTEIGYIKAGVDDIKRKQDGQEDKHNQLSERVTRIEESTKQAHLRINRIEGE